MAENNASARVRPASLKTRVSVIETKIDMFIDEMRERDSQRAAEIREIRASIDVMNNKIDEMGRHVRNIAVTTIIGIAAIGAAVVGFVYAIAPKIVGG